MEQRVSDVQTLEEFECLLGESPTNYPKGESIENMESELHSASIDTEIYEQTIEQNMQEATHSLQTSTKVFIFIYVFDMMASYFCYRL